MLVLCTVLSSDSVSLCLLTRTNKHKKAVIKNQCNLGTRMIKLENAGLRAPRKMSLGSGLHSQKRIRAPVSKMIGLRAPQQTFQGSRAPGTPPLGPCLLYRPEITEKTKWARNEKIPGGSHAVRYQFYKDTMRNQYKQFSSANNYRPRMLLVL